MMILHVGPLGGEGQKLAVGMLTLHSVPGFVPSRYKGNRRQLTPAVFSTVPSRSPQSPQDFCIALLHPQCLCPGLRSHPVYSTLFLQHCILGKTA